MRFLIDRCAGQLLADWLRTQGHDVVDSRELGLDPGDRALLDWAAKERRILVTIDTDFGQLIYLENLSHAGLVRLPDVLARERQLIYAGFTEALRNRTAKRCYHHSARWPDQNLDRPRTELRVAVSLC